MGWIKLWETYNKVKDVFVKPKIGFYWGKWRNDPCLPCYRCGPTISLVNVFKWDKTYRVQDVVKVKGKLEKITLPDGATTNIQCYERSEHKLPGGLTSWDYMWKRAYRKKLRKFGLGWLKPRYTLPIWFAFHIFNHDLFYKTKWTAYDFRYEFPPQFTIVLFGISFSWWLKAPELADFYWEGILHYLYGKEPKSLKNAIYEVGKWRKVGGESYFGLKKEYLKPKYWDEYDEIIKSYET